MNGRPSINAFSFHGQQDPVLSISPFILAFQSGDDSALSRVYMGLMMDLGPHKAGP